MGRGLRLERHTPVQLKSGTPPVNALDNIKIEAQVHYFV